MIRTITLLSALIIKQSSANNVPEISRIYERLVGYKSMVGGHRRLVEYKILGRYKRLVGYERLLGHKTLGSISEINKI